MEIRKNWKPWACGAMAGLIMLTGAACDGVKKPDQDAEPTPNPVVAYAESRGLVPGLVEALEVLGEDGEMDKYEKVLVDEVVQSPPAITQTYGFIDRLYSIVEDEKVSGSEIEQFREWVQGTDENGGEEDQRPADADNDGLVDGLDEDGDGLSNWFERNVNKTDPLMPNDRYAIVATNTGSWGCYDIKEQCCDMLELLYGWDPENITALEREDSMLLKFKRAVEEVAEKADENDLVYIDIQADYYEDKPPWYSKDQPGLGRGVWGIYFYDSEPLRFQELDQLLDEINCRTLVVATSMGNCGNILDHLKEGPCPRIVYVQKSPEFYSAFGEGNIIYGIESDMEYGDRDGWVSLKEAYDYLSSVPSQAPFVNGQTLEGKDLSNVAAHTYFGEYNLKEDPILEDDLFKDKEIVKKYLREVTVPTDQELAEKYLPSLQFDGRDNGDIGEKYFPVRFDFDDENIENNSSNYVKFHIGEINESYPNHLDQRPAVYIHHTRIGGYKVIEYWYYYCYNNCAVIADHEHDWEAVFVYLDNKSLEPVGVYLSTHDFGNIECPWIPWEQLEQEGLLEDGTHPLLGVEGGGHGTGKWYNEEDEDRFLVEDGVTINWNGDIEHDEERATLRGEDTYAPWQKIHCDEDGYEQVHFEYGLITKWHTPWDREEWDYPPSPPA